MLEADNVKFSYGTREVLKGLTFEIKSGEFVAILGANGAGKSTLIKLLSGVETPSGGQVLIDGKSIKSFGVRELARMRAVLSQEATMAFDCDVLDAVLLGRYAYGNFSASHRDIEIAKKALGEVELSGFETRRYFQLSGGEKRRVQLARTLCQLAGRDDYNGCALLLDEPSAGLDPAHAHISLACAKKLSDANASVVAVLHDPNLASLYADKIALLKGGKLIAYGTPREVVTAELMHETYNAQCKIISDCGVNFALFLKR